MSSSYVSGSSRESETLASLNLAKGILTALQRKGLLSSQEISDILNETAEPMGASVLVQAKGAAEIIKTVAQETLEEEQARR